MSGMFNLNARDVANGLVMAIISPAFVALTGVVGAIIMAPGFDVFNVDWGMLGHNLLNLEIVVSYGAATGYLTKNFFTTTAGSFANITPNNA